MNTKTLLRTFFTVVMLCVTTVLFAQATADKLFLQGQELQKVMTIKSQNDAIKKFNAAKASYKTEEKKKMCDNQISICNQNISNIRKGSSGGGASNAKSGKATSDAVESPTQLSISPSTLFFDGDKSGRGSVAVTAPSVEWSFTSETGLSGTESFATIHRSNDLLSINVETKPNPTTLERQQTLNVIYHDKSQILTIRQAGKTVTLSADKNLVEFKAKGGSKTIELYTNSDSIIAENNNLTWYVESKPDWVEINGNVQKRKGIIGSLAKIGKEVISGTAVDAEKVDIKISDVKIQVMGIAKSSPEFQTGRKGEIIFASQNVRYKVTIVQQ